MEYTYCCMFRRHLIFTYFCCDYSKRARMYMYPYQKYTFVNIAYSSTYYCSMYSPRMRLQGHFILLCIVFGLATNALNVRNNINKYNILRVHSSTYIPVLASDTFIIPT